ncbi:BLUF domain-containing protein [Spiribacter vilamensis]|uniref:FAD-dependent sensor of blue light n=1 Tax=Spiribacter vilamensis TaxID=531306 RepID=A0A4Q8D0E4_9GAMM|nr:BLUF domain-containing protein [Spiribacter vilamensis]RZU98732.1 FAD-dependent sensor of blue light [Spiribacter vilamensis]TVO62244.1 BLUF domain-containing protein [Spiribacter vilamensis]
MSQLYSLAYISKNSIQKPRQEVEEEIADILASAHKNNPSLNVTGALLYSGDVFCQVIEGEEDTLEDLFEEIQMDDRHSDIAVLHFEPIESRGFSEWAMAFAGIEDEERFDLSGILESKDKMKMHETGKNLVSVLENLLSQHQSVQKG